MELLFQTGKPVFGIAKNKSYSERNASPEGKNDRSFLISVGNSRLNVMASICRFVSNHSTPAGR